LADPLTQHAPRIATQAVGMQFVLVFVQASEGAEVMLHCSDHSR
jgi:hypothetical protein